ncbi:MAG: two-component sensor histidine kinase, partial [Brevundimonas sp.]
MATPRFIARLFGPRLIKRIMPTSLFGRTLLIIVLPMGVMQLFVTLLLFNIHWETVTGRLTSGVAGDVAAFVDAWKADPSPAGRERLQVRAQQTQGLSIIYRPGPLPGGDRANIFKSLDRTLRAALDEALNEPFWFDTTRYPNFVDIRVKVGDGQLVFIAPKDHVFAPSAWIFVLLQPGS